SEIAALCSQCWRPHATGPGERLHGCRYESRPPLSPSRPAPAPCLRLTRRRGRRDGSGRRASLPAGTNSAICGPGCPRRVFRKASGLATRPTGHQEHPRPSQQTVRLGQSCREKQQIVGQETNSYHPPLVADLCCFSTPTGVRGMVRLWNFRPRDYSPPLMPAALMMGHHFSISAFWWVASPSGVCCSRGKISCPSSAIRERRFDSDRTACTAALSLVIPSFGAPLGIQRPTQTDR